MASRMALFLVLVAEIPRHAGGKGCLCVASVTKGANSLALVVEECLVVKALGSRTYCGFLNTTLTLYLRQADLLILC